VFQKKLFGFMLIKEKIGNLSSFDADGLSIDMLHLQWYECNKRILHKRTESGNEVTLKFLQQAPQLQQNDVLYADEKILIAVEILPCEAIVVKPSTMYEMAYVCYEVGNKHLPLFFEDEELLIPYDAPTFRLLQASGFDATIQERKLLNPLKTTVAPHAHTGSESLFSKILKLTTSNE
jgi:urease accessory protein